MATPDFERMEGMLSKKPRGRGGFFSRMAKPHWDDRRFVLYKQALYYFDAGDDHNEFFQYLQDFPEGKGWKVSPKGSVSTKDCSVALVNPCDADDRPNAFAVTTSKASPDGLEVLYLTAASETLRHKWMQCIEASSHTEKWCIKSKAVQKKTGADITAALLAKKRDLSGAEDSVGNALEILAGMTKNNQRKKELQELEKSLKVAGLDQSASAEDTLLRTAAIEKTLKTERVKAAVSRIQFWFRRKAVLRREYLALYFKQCVVLVQTRIRIYLSKRRIRRIIISLQATRIICNLLVRYVAAKRLWKRQWRTGGTFSVHIRKATGLLSSSVSSSVFVRTMSCVDRSNPPRFKGKDETNVKNGYGLKVTSLHKGKSIPYCHDPDWEEEETKPEPSITVNTVDDCFIVLTLMTFDSVSRSDSFLGQAVVSVREHRAKLYSGQELVFDNYPLIRYVAPVENTEGVAQVVLNVALQVRNVTGTISFSLKMCNPLKSSCFLLNKESNALFSFSDTWKTRDFAIANNAIIYAKSKCEFGEEGAKHYLDLSKVTNITLEAFDKKQPKEKQIVLTFKENPVAKPEVWRIRWQGHEPLRERNHLLRVLHRSMPQFPAWWIEENRAISHRFTQRFEADAGEEIAKFQSALQARTRRIHNVLHFIENRAAALAGAGAGGAGSKGVSQPDSEPSLKAAP